MLVKGGPVRCHLLAVLIGHIIDGPDPGVHELGTGVELRPSGGCVPASGGQERLLSRVLEGVPSVPVVGQEVDGLQEFRGGPEALGNQPLTPPAHVVLIVERARHGGGAGEGTLP